MKIDSIQTASRQGIKPVRAVRHNYVMTNHPEESQIKQKVYASNLCFRSGITNTTMLMNDYKWFINNDRLPAIEAFLKLKAPKENIREVFNHIIEKDETSYGFIDSIVSQPRKIKHYAKALKDMLPEHVDIYNLFSPQNPYIKAYARYMDIRYQNATSVSELLKIRPDWKEEVLLAKHRELYHNDNFELGVIPESIGAENFDAIIQYLNKFMDYGFKTNKNIADLTLNGKTFKFQNIIDGKSNKNVFVIETENNEKFILKIDSPQNRGLNKPFSNGTCAIIDRYLTENNCRNAAPLRYYNHNTNVSIYDYINHSSTRRIMYSLNEFVETMPDFADLGLRHADTVGTNNYFLLDKTQDAMRNSYDFDYGVAHGEFVSVDNDHVTFNQPLSPLIDKYHRPLPVEMQMFF